VNTKIVASGEIWQATEYCLKIVYVRITNQALGMPHPRFAMYVKNIVHTYVKVLFSSGCTSYMGDSK